MIYENIDVRRFSTAETLRIRSAHQLICDMRITSRGRGARRDRASS